MGGTDLWCTCGVCLSASVPSAREGVREGSLRVLQLGRCGAGGIEGTARILRPCFLCARGGGLQGFQAQGPQVPPVPPAETGQGQAEARLVQPPVRRKGRISVWQELLHICLLHCSKRRNISITPQDTHQPPQ